MITMLPAPAYYVGIFASCALLWSLISLFVLPVIIIEGTDIVSALKISIQRFLQSFNEIIGFVLAYPIIALLAVVPVAGLLWCLSLIDPIHFNDIAYGMHDGSFLEILIKAIFSVYVSVLSLVATGAIALLYIYKKDSIPTADVQKESLINPTVR